METVTAFKHNFTEENVEGIMGFAKCLAEMVRFLNEKTEMNPAKRMVDAVEILDKVAATSKELTILLQKAHIRLQNQKNAPLN